MRVKREEVVVIGSREHSIVKVYVLILGQKGVYGGHNVFCGLQIFISRVVGYTSRGFWLIGE